MRIIIGFMPYPEEYYKMFDAGEYSSSSSAECLMSCNLSNNSSSSSCGISKSKKSKNKRRFSDDQIKSLETIFDTETKLEPKKKLQLARELGLQPRQVAVWFQNKRARWKSKQLERDYSLLQSSYDSLASQFVSLKKERQTLLEQLQKLSELMDKSDEKEAECHRSYEDSGGPGRNIDGDADGADNNMIKNNSAASTRAGGDQLVNAKKVGVFLDTLSDDDDESSRNPGADDSCAYLGLEEEAAAQLPLNIASGPAHTCNLTQAEEWGTLEVESDATLLDQPCINGYKWWDFWL